MRYVINRSSSVVEHAAGLQVGAALMSICLSTSVNLGHKAEEEKAFSSTRRIRDRRPGHSHGSRASVFAEVGLWGVAL